MQFASEDITTMDIFLELLQYIVPLYLFIFIGYLSGRYLEVSGHNVAKLIMYIFTPLTLFYGLVHTSFSYAILTLPVIAAILSTMMGYSFMRFGHWWFKDSRGNIIAHMSGTGNTGYFGLPMALFLFPEYAGLYMAGIFGVSLYEATFGMYWVARGKYSVKDALQRVIRMPLLYAFILGALGSAFTLKPPMMFDPMFEYIRGGYVALGMMMVGVAIAGSKTLVIDVRLFSLATFARYVVWPLAAIGYIYLDKTFLHLLVPEAYLCLTLLSIVPLAANSAALASLFNIHPEAAATTVLINTLIGLVYVPCMVMWLLL